MKFYCQIRDSIHVSSNIYGWNPFYLHNASYPLRDIARAIKGPIHYFIRGNNGQYETDYCQVHKPEAFRPEQKLPIYYRQIFFPGVLSML